MIRLFNKPSLGKEDEKNTSLWFELNEKQRYEYTFYVPLISVDFQLLLKDLSCFESSVKQILNMQCNFFKSYKEARNFLHDKCMPRNGNRRHCVFTIRCTKAFYDRVVDEQVIRNCKLLFDRHSSIAGLCSLPRNNVEVISVQETFYSQTLDLRTHRWDEQAENEVARQRSGCVVS